MPVRNIVIGAALLAALLWFNWQVRATERHIAEGQPLFAELGTTDPRSLIQGDYMILDYRLTDVLPAGDLPPRGLLAVRTRDDGVAEAARILAPGEALAPGEILVGYKRSGFSINVGPDSYFFQEGEAERYGAARYAELRVLPDGAVMLVALRDENLVLVGQPLFR